MEHPPDVFVLGRVFYARIADELGRAPLPCFMVAEPDEPRWRFVKAVT
jgi:hypothetical protein